jgi:hypothetical protein
MISSSYRYSRKEERQMTRRRRVDPGIIALAAALGMNLDALGE